MVQRAMRLSADPGSTPMGQLLEETFQSVRDEMEVRQGFPHQVIEELRQTMADPDLPERDETDVEFITIDPPGSMDLDQALHGSFRMNLNRQIVGEVRGPEAAAMLKAMQSGSGSISTTHAAHAVGALEKLVTCVMESGQHATHDFALRAVAAGVDIVVHVTKQTRPAADGTAQVSRFVSEIIAVAPGEEQTGYAVTHVFKADVGTGVARPPALPDDYRDLSRFGFDLAAFTQAQDGTGA